MINGREEKEAACSHGEVEEPEMVVEPPNTAVETAVRAQVEPERQQPAEGGDSDLQTGVAESDRDQTEDSSECMQRFY